MHEAIFSTVRAWKEVLPKKGPKILYNSKLFIFSEERYKKDSPTAWGME